MTKIKMSDIKVHERIFLYAIRSRSLAIMLFIILFALFTIQIIEDYRMLVPLFLPINITIAMAISYFRRTEGIIFDEKTGKHTIKKC